MADTPEIRFEHVGRTYQGRAGATEALKSVDFSVGKNEFVSLVGPSGCGKSTALMLMAGLEKPDYGTVAIEGQLVSQPSDRVGIVFQDATLLPWKSVMDNVLYPARIRGIPVKQIEPAAAALLELMGLDRFRNRLPHELSGGMRQRVGICRALAYSPRILLLDEPFSALDALTRDEMNLLLLEITERLNQTVVLITHSVSEALLLSDRVLVMSSRPGRIVADITVPFSRPRSSASVLHSAAFRQLEDQIRNLIAGRELHDTARTPGAVFRRRLENFRQQIHNESTSPILHD
ncbi:ABC transporter ATP-binding protein [Bordetella sp. BOR01]|uniref:ABC transporter ATP-binding protein n=1 Tax=Bordetella sp. BOR01 TaxID=2854779 RepID=UPI001C44A5A2|nr:ABC transporter ATP-binding protein [Bordetella sp. BOR01]MBV7481679.1 ABC transporter ATP-binding protein [Bordetella sp. BOR01]